MKAARSMVRIGAWVFDPASRLLLRGRAENRLSVKAADVLAALAETPGQVWSRDALLERVWPGVTVGEEVLTHAIAELRRALGDQARAPTYVHTIHKSGYRLLARVERVVAPEAVSDDSDLARAFMAPLGASNSITCDARDDVDLYVYARYLEACELYERGGRKNTSAAAALFALVLEAAPHFALAHAGMAKALAFLEAYYEKRSPGLELAMAHCAAALKLDAALAQAKAAEGFVLAIGGDFRSGVESFKRALRLDAYAAETHYLLGRACLAEGEHALAAAMLERAAALRPDDYHAAVLAGKVRKKTQDELRAQTNYAIALPRAEARLGVHPKDYRALCTKARCLWQLGRRDEAMPLMDEVATHPDPMNYHLACTYARAGEHGRALDVLEQVVELGWRHGAWLAQDPDFDGLRDEPRYKRIAASI